MADRTVPRRKAEGGEGATAADVERGYLTARPAPGPERDPANYKQRMSVGSDEVIWDPPPAPEGERDTDFSFSMRGRRSTGMLKRPWPPNERN